MVESLETCDRPEVDRKALERDTGFLNHLAMTFEDFNPFLKGCYLSLNSWRTGRDQEGWKLPDKVWGRMMVSQLENDLISQEELDIALQGLPDQDAPKMVKVCPRFKKRCDRHGSPP